MALLRGKDVPEGSLRLSEEEAIQYQLKLINGWEPKSDVWPFHFGFGILGAECQYGHLDPEDSLSSVRSNASICYTSWFFCCVPNFTCSFGRFYDGITL
ncbi:uncharacterized protein [Periplaneta americana]|uniref:uncharacterized protein isoform X3 n=1 Tax=Periplaneta americana TaxID=6978 RepID=UPI0037E7D573